MTESRRAPQIKPVPSRRAPDVHLCRGQKKLALLSASFAAAALASACVSGGNGPAAGAQQSAALAQEANFEVTERSKMQLPAWLTLPPGELNTATNELRLVTARSKLLNLPLGLKHTELAAIEAARAALVTTVKAALQAAAEAKGVGMPHNVADLELQIRAAIDEPAAPAARVADIYFESRTNRALPPSEPMATYYAVFVLVSFPKDQLPLLFSGVERHLRRSLDSETRGLAAVAQTLAHPHINGTPGS